MKKKLKKLSLKKELGLELTDAMLQEVNGGLEEKRTDGCTKGNTSGCTDGCTPFVSMWNCTNGYCTDDCTVGAGCVNHTNT